MKKLIIIVTLCMFLSTSVYAGEGEVSVDLPDFDVIVNGEYIDSTLEAYPFITYKGITYLPMTYDLSSALGLSTSWHAEKGLTIKKAKEVIPYKPKRNSGYNSGHFKAKPVSFPVTVNGEVIDNSKEEYPLLSFRDVTYFPMTYRFMVKSFQSGYNFSASEGLKVSADETLKVRYPMSIHKEFTVNVETLKDEIYFANDLMRLSYNGDFFEPIYINQEKDSQYDGMNLTIEVDYYSNDQYVMTESIYGGIPQGYGTDHKYVGLIFDYKNITDLVFKFDFMNKNDFDSRLQSYEDETNMVVTTSDKVTLDYLKSLGGAFMTVRENVFNGVNKELTHDELKYSAYNGRKKIYVNDMEVQITTLGRVNNTLEYDIKSRTDDFIDFKTITDIAYDPKALNYQVKSMFGKIEKSADTGSVLCIYDKKKKLVSIVILEDINR